jgi:hypothetical protein
MYWLGGVKRTTDEHARALNAVWWADHKGGGRGGGSEDGAMPRHGCRAPINDGAKVRTVSDLLLPLSHAPCVKPTTACATKAYLLPA